MDKIESNSGIPEDELHREGLIDRLTQYLEADPKAWHMRYNLALALTHKGELDEALAQFQQVLAVSPKHMESLINMGGIHLSRNQPDLALKAFTKALSVWDTPLVRANLAVAYMQLGQLEEAERHLRQVLEAKSDMPDAWANLGSCLLQQGKMLESIEASQKAVELMDTFAVAHNNLAAAFWELNRLEEAKAHAQKALELDYPVHEQLLANLGLQPLE
jgi:tetratricopeptide (TPR) repeat protein